MRNAKYPRLGEYRDPKPASGRKCSICGAAPAGFQFVQIGYMRGDDESSPCCKRTECKAAVLEKWR
jgi:hypothetical protein